MAPAARPTVFHSLPRLANRRARSSGARLAAVLLTLAVAATLPERSALAQDSSPSEDTAIQPTQGSAELGFGAEVEVRWVLVPAVVQTPKGYVEDLEQQDFTLFVDDRPTPIASFETGTEAPVSIVYLQDLSGSIANGNKLELSRWLLNCLLDHARPYDDFTIATFGNGEVGIDMPQSSDVAALRSSMWRWQPRGTTALHDAVAWLPELGPRGESAKRIAILVTDGFDNASTLSGDEARELVRQAELPVYVLGLRSGSTPIAEADHLPPQPFLYVLRLLAHQTGGRYFTVTPADDLGTICSQILADLRHQYVLGFPAAGGEEYHPIRVEVDGRKRRVSARKGYTGGAPTTP